MAIPDPGVGLGSSFQPANRKRLPGAADARNRPASYSPLCEQADDKADAAPGGRLPVRTCLGCGIKATKAELVRLVVSAGQLVVDRRGALPGRGVYCCRKAACFQRLVKQRKKLAWALRHHEPEKTPDFVLSQGLDAEFGAMGDCPQG